MTAQRILAVLAAVLFIAAVALAAAGPGGVPLSQAMAWLSATGVETMHRVTIRVFGPWPWAHLLHPLLLRPAWLPFASLGLLCAGAALSLSGRDAARRSTRRS